ncbi:MAG: hypothetical protein KH972_07315 [Peptostreptococcaceae bacterium]|nr:hypothetical protein [Peptostreptococcaceae bacterium]
MEQSDTKKVPNLIEFQTIEMLAGDIKAAFSAVIEQTRKIFKVLTLTLREAAELYLLEQKKKRMLKKINAQRRAIRKKYQEQIAEAMLPTDIKIKREKRRKAIEFILVILITAVVFRFACIAGEIERGHKAYGGEYFLLLTPFLYYAAKGIAEDYKDLKDKQ